MIYVWYITYFSLFLILIIIIIIRIIIKMYWTYVFVKENVNDKRNLQKDYGKIEKRDEEDE